MKRKIVNSGNDTQANHRPDFETCPDCEHRMKYDAWEKRATTLIIHPHCYRSSCVVVMSECPKCFKESWVHERMSSFHDYCNDRWPKMWIERVKKLESEIKLTALRNWGKGLCWNCKHLESGTVEYTAWRSCIKGTGPAETECDKYEQHK